MRASLDKNLLLMSLVRGGWLSPVEGENGRWMSPLVATCSNVAQSKEWLLSRYLSRQCALASVWTGNGLDISQTFCESTHIDFKQLENDGNLPQDMAEDILTFSTSACRQYLLVARGSVIYVYHMRGESILPVTRILCPRRVLLVSMDASAGRYAVAALLQGRMGMLYEPQRGSDKDDCLIKSHNECRSSLFELATATPTSRLLQKKGIEPFNAVDVLSDREYISLQSTDDERSHERNIINQTWNLELNGPKFGSQSQMKMLHGTCTRNIPTKRGTSTFYRRLCSEDDPPRSVAICPGRRCVAFGCSAGIELFWVDAITGQSLSR